MKKSLFMIIIFLCVFYFYNNAESLAAFTSNNIQEELSRKIIRFHVIANSDSVDDQELKLTVKDEVVKNIYGLLKGSTSVENSRQVIMNNLDTIQNIALATIRQNGYNYDVSVNVEMTNFPIKSYGGVFSLPQGQYESLNIKIGKALGRNWWCVMFPPLCFVDGVTDENSNELYNVMESYFTEDEINAMYCGDDNLELKFKILEILSSQNN